MNTEKQFKSCHLQVVSSKFIWPNKNVGNPAFQRRKKVIFEINKIFFKYLPVPILLKMPYVRPQQLCENVLNHQKITDKVFRLTKVEIYYIICSHRNPFVNKSDYCKLSCLCITNSLHIFNNFIFSKVCITLVPYLAVGLYFYYPPTVIV